MFVTKRLVIYHLQTPSRPNINSLRSAPKINSAIKRGCGEQAVPTNLSVLSRASSPNGKVPRNWHVGHRCCLYRTMTCRICVEIRHFTIKLQTIKHSCAGGPSRCCLSVLLHSLLSSSRALSLFLLYLTRCLRRWGSLFLSSFLLALQTSRKCLEYHRRWRLRCRCASVGGAAEPSGGWLTAGWANQRAGCAIRYRPVSCCWSISASFPEKL